MAEGVVRRDEAKEMLGNEEFEVPRHSSELLEMMQMTRDERRRLLEDSVSEAARDYAADSEWLEASLEATPQ